MDETTIKLLRLVERDAGVSREQLGTMLGVSGDEVARRLGDLEQSRVIVRRKAIVNWERAGIDLVSALVEVRVSPQRDVGFDSIAERIASFPEARSVSLVSGAFDLSVEVVGRTMKDVAAFVSERLAPLDGVQGTATHFLLRRYKVDGELLEGSDSASRLPFVP